MLYRTADGNQNLWFHSAKMLPSKNMKTEDNIPDELGLQLIRLGRILLHFGKKLTMIILDCMLFLKSLLFLSPAELWYKFQILTCTCKPKNEEKQDIIEWIKNKVPKDALSKSSSPWKDGILLCALMESLVKGSCPRYDLLNPAERLKNWKLALRLFEKHVGVKSFVTSEELCRHSINSDHKILSLLSQLKLSASKFKLKGVEVTNSLKLNPVTVIETQHGYIAKGMGLFLAVKGRMTHFNLYVNSKAQLNLIIEIQGPESTCCRERIYVAPQSKSCGTKTDYAVTDSRSDVQDPEICIHKRIPFEYELTPGKLAINYMPLVDGKHSLNIVHQGQHIAGSPYIIHVDKSIDVPEHSEISSNYLKNLQSSRRPSRSSADNSFSNTTYRNYNLENREVRFIEHLNKTGLVIRKRILRHKITIDGKDIIVDNLQDLHSAIKDLSVDCTVEDVLHRNNHKVLNNLRYSRLHSHKSNEVVVPTRDENIPRDKFISLKETFQMLNGKSTIHNPFKTRASSYNALGVSLQSHRGQFQEQAVESAVNNPLKEFPSKQDSSEDICHPSKEYFQQLNVEPLMQKVSEDFELRHSTQKKTFLASTNEFRKLDTGQMTSLETSELKEDISNNTSQLSNEEFPMSDNQQVNEYFSNVFILEKHELENAYPSSQDKFQNPDVDLSTHNSFEASSILEPANVNNTLKENNDSSLLISEHCKTSEKLKSTEMLNFYSCHGDTTNDTLYKNSCNDGLYDLKQNIGTGNEGSYNYCVSPRRYGNESDLIMASLESSPSRNQSLISYRSKTVLAETEKHSNISDENNGFESNQVDFSFRNKECSSSDFLKSTKDHFLNIIHEASVFSDQKLWSKGQSPIEQQIFVKNTGNCPLNNQLQTTGLSKRHVYKQDIIGKTENNSIKDLQEDKESNLLHYSISSSKNEATDANVKTGNFSTSLEFSYSEIPFHDHLNLVPPIFDIKQIDTNQNESKMPLINENLNVVKPQPKLCDRHTSCLNNDQQPSPKISLDNTPSLENNKSESKTSGNKFPASTFSISPGVSNHLLIPRSTLSTTDGGKESLSSYKELLQSSTSYDSDLESAYKFQDDISFGSNYSSFKSDQNWEEIDSVDDLSKNSNLLNLPFSYSLTKSTVDGGLNSTERAINPNLETRNLSRKSERRPSWAGLSVLPLIKENSTENLLADAKVSTPDNELKRNNDDGNKHASIQQEKVNFEKNVNIIPSHQSLVSQNKFADKMAFFEKLLKNSSEASNSRPIVKPVKRWSAINRHIQLFEKTHSEENSACDNKDAESTIDSSIIKQRKRFWETFPES